MSFFDDLNPINAINSAINAIQDQATSVINTIDSGLQDLGNDVANAATNAADAVSGGVDSAIGGVKSAANDVAQETLTAASDVANVTVSTANAVIQWSSLNVAKGVAITAILLGISKTLPSDPNAAALQALVDAVSAGFAKLNPVSTDWHTWIASHAQTGDAEFGTTTVLDEDYTNFSLFKSSIARWDEMTNKTLVPALQKAKDAKDVPSFTALKTALQQSVAAALKISTSIQKNYQNMAAQGLADHEADLQAALTSLA